MRSPQENDAGRRARFERLYDAHYAPVLAYALRRSGRTVAHDVAAETFLVAWRRLDDVPVDAAPWLYGVARRVLANERRAEKRRAALAERMRVTPPPQPDTDPAGRRGLLEAALARAVGTLLIAGEQRSAPQRFAVLSALADEVSGQGRILHVLERTIQLTPDGNPRGDVHEEESWTLLGDATVSRFRIGTGRDAEQGAADHRGSSDYDPRSNAVTVVRQPGEGAKMAAELPVVRMARDAGNGKLRVAARPVIDGRRTLKIEVDDGAWYIAQDAPELVRRELRLPGGGIQRTDFLTFEVLDATPANRELLRIQAPPNARVETVTPRPNRPPASIPRPPAS